MTNDVVIWHGHFVEIRILYAWVKLLQDYIYNLLTRKLQNDHVFSDPYCPRHKTTEFILVVTWEAYNLPRYVVLPYLLHRLYQGQIQQK